MHGQHGHDHPLRTVLPESMKPSTQLEALAETSCASRLGARCPPSLLRTLSSSACRSMLLSSVVHGFGAHACASNVVAVLFDGFEIHLGSVSSWPALQRGLARIDDHEGPRNRARARCDARVMSSMRPMRDGMRLQEPDVRDRARRARCGPCARGARGPCVTSTPQRLADDAAMLDALVLAAGALVVLHRAEDRWRRTDRPFGLERAVVDGLRILDLALRPRRGWHRARRR